MRKILNKLLTLGHLQASLHGSRLITIFTLLLTALGLNTACSQNFENMDVQQFSELIADTNVVILDVRKAEEFAEGHIKGGYPD